MAVASHVSHASFDQGAAGSTALVAAPGAGFRIVVHALHIGLTLSGTYQLLSSATALTGAVPVLGSAPVELSGGEDGTLRCAANEALNLTTTLGAAKGVVWYSVEATS